MGFFDFSLLDVWNNPITQILRGGTKLAAKGIASAIENSGDEPAELAELLDVAKSGDADAQCGLAMYYVNNREFEKAKFWFEKSAKQGNEDAIELLGFWRGDA